MSDYYIVDEDGVDGCDLDFRDPVQLTDDEDILALAMFADVFGDEKAVEQRRVELVDLDAAFKLERDL